MNLGYYLVHFDLHEMAEIRLPLAGNPLSRCRAPPPFERSQRGGMQAESHDVGKTDFFFLCIFVKSCWFIYAR